MTAYVQDGNSTVEWSAYKPKVYIGEVGGIQQYYENLHCLRIEYSGGINPSKAYLRETSSLDATRQEQRPNKTLTPSWFYRHGSRVMIKDVVGDVERIIFLGSLHQRQDSASSDVAWTAIDDRDLLAKIPVRGALVRDNDGSIKYISRFNCQTNPGGMWNCTAAEYNGLLYPVFSPNAYYGKNYEEPNEQFDNPLVNNGNIIPWTPRRFLQYLQLLANISESDGIDGVYADSGWRSLANCSRLKFLADSVSMIDSSNIPNDIFDPLNRKMPDVNFQGKNLLIALNDTLTTVGTHGLNLLINQAGYSEVSFYQKFPVISEPTNELDDSGNEVPSEPVGKILKLQRRGSASIPGSNTIYDFQVFEDSTNSCESVLVEGQPVYLETELNYNPDAISTSSLKPAWTEDEEIAFLYMINGSSTATSVGDGYAKIPLTQWNEKAAYSVFNASNFTSANGEAFPGSSELKPWVQARTQAAVALARATFPRVFKCFYIDSQYLPALAGYNDVFSDTSKYPVLDYKRPILPEQLQYMLTSQDSTDNVYEWLKSNYPVRVQVKKEADEQFHDSTYQSGIRVSGDGLIWLDSICESINGTDECVYDESILANPLGCVMKRIKINAAMPLDHRVSGYQTIKNINQRYATEDNIGSSEFVATYNQLLGQDAYTLRYIDSRGSYNEFHQVDSTPCSSLNYIQGQSEVEIPISRILPNGEERDDATYYALKRLITERTVKKVSSFKVVGIRYDYSIGDWILNITGIVSPDVTDATFADTTIYSINAPVENITLDFEAQSTNIGGLITEF